MKMYHWMGAERCDVTVDFDDRFARVPDFEIRRDGHGVELWTPFGIVKFATNATPHMQDWLRRVADALGKD